MSDVVPDPTLLWPSDPSQVTLPPTTWPYELSQLTDGELTNAIAVMRLVCGKNKWALTRIKRKNACVLMSVLQWEQQKRSGG